MPKAQALPLMPKATAVWLVDNTALTFDQIALFCGLHPLEIKAMADGEVNIGMVGMSPVASGQLTDEEIKRCEADPTARLGIMRHELPQPELRTKGPRYTPVTKRADKPDGVAFLIKTFPELADIQIAKLLGTTKDTIAKIRDRSHWNASNIKPRDPIVLGLCKRADLDAALAKARRRAARQEKELAKEMAGQIPASDESRPMMLEQDNEPDEESGLVTSFGGAADEEQPEDNKVKLDTF